MSNWKDIGLNFGLVIGLSQALRLIDVTNPYYLNGIRILYTITNLIFFGILYYCYIEIGKVHNTKELKYVENPPAFSEATPVTIITTYEEYDRGELLKFVRTSLFSLAISLFFHFKMGYVQPIFIQSFLPLKNVWNNPIVKLYALKQQEKDELKRPFKVNTNPFAGSASTANPKLKSKSKNKKKQ